MTPAARRTMGLLAFGAFAWLLSILRDYQGETRAAVGALAGAALMMALHLLGAEARSGSGGARGGGAA